MTVKRLSETADTHGGFAQTPVTVCARIPAKVAPLSGRELERAQQIDPRARYDVRARYRTDILAGQTLIHHDGRRGDRTFEIVAPPIDVESEHVELQILCGEAATLSSEAV